jgi:hypothetical protein
MPRWLPVSLLLSAGCASIPWSGARFTGEPLSVESGETTYTSTRLAPVESVERTDESGNTRTKTLYEQQTFTNTVPYWNLKQGDQLVDEEAFYRTAGKVRLPRTASGCGLRAQASWPCSRGRH